MKGLILIGFSLTAVLLVVIAMQLMQVNKLATAQDKLEFCSQPRTYFVVKNLMALRPSLTVDEACQLVYETRGTE